jgi:N-sulfoglucosamine sulfohydrolase
MVKMRLILILALSLVCITANAKDKIEKYNILWLSCEDMDPILSCYGAKGINTPNIDRLANEGIRYTNAYSTVGVCAPSRSSIITGVYPVRLGTHNMRTAPLFGYNGIDGEQYASYRPLNGKRGRNIPYYSAVPEADIKCFTEYLRKAGYYCTNHNKTDYQFYTPFTSWDEIQNGDYKNAPDGMPFFSVYNHNTTHESRIWMYADHPLLANPEDVQVPNYYPDIPVVRKDIARKYSNIEELDAKIGEKLKQLEKDGLLDKTIIFFWSDHGGPLLRQKRAVGNTGLHVPLIVRFPDKRQAGAVNNDLVSLMDLGPTVLSLTGIKPPEYMDGQAFLGEYKEEKREQIFGSADRFDETYDFARSVIDGNFSYIRNFNTSIPYIYRIEYREQIEMTRKLIEMDSKGELVGDAAYIFRDSRDIEELYDLKNDPYEVHSLANDPKYRNQLTKMREQLAHWQLAVGDKGFIDEYDMVQMFWPGFIQPETDDVEVEQMKNTISFSSPTAGASIGYQVDELIGTERWLLYSNPIKLKSAQQVVVRAKRIGYRTSNPVTFIVE